MRSRAATRWSAIALACALILLAVGPATAQSDSEDGIVQITVQDDASQVLSNARVFLLGPTTASALTNKTGIVKYTDVPVGIYRVRVSKGGYVGVTSRSFEVLGNKQVDVSVNLGQFSASRVPSPPPGNALANSSSSNQSSTGLKVIGTTRARVAISTSDVDDTSAVRRISDSLLDALSTVAGVDVTQSSNDPNAPQTISLHGHDESQTAVTLDGIPLSAPGSAANLRAINTDLFTGASASFGARAGALGGGVNFTTLQPTKTWQSRLGASYGSFDKYNWSIGETGSIGKLGIAVLTTKRGGNNPLTFQDYLDTSGLTYPHGGEMTNAGDYVKLRYELTDNTNVLFTALQNNQGVATLCTQFTTLLPCGIGPNNTSNSKFGFMYATVQSLIGQTAVSVTGYTSSQQGFNNEVNRYIDGVPEPFASNSDSFTHGIAASATITKDKHTITFNGSTFASTTTSTPIVATGTSTLVTPSLNAISAGTYQVVDSYKINDRLSLGPTASFATTTGAGSSVLGGLATSWRPNDNDTFSASVSVGSSQPGSNIVRSYSDPQAARVNCAAGTAQVSGPGDQPTKQSAIDYSLNWTHQWTHGQVTFDAYRQTQAGQLVTAQVTGDAANLSPGYLAAVGGYYSTVCATQVAPNVYVSEPVNGTTRLYQGYDITARLALGRDVTAIPSFSTNSSIYTAADPAFTGIGSTLILDSQIYGRPLHRGNFTIDAYHPPSKLELIANAQYVGINNGQHLAPYVNFSAGISRPLGIGQITLFETNMFNTETALFSTLQYAVPQPINGGGYLLTAANPLAPRTIQVSYSFNTGASPGAGFAKRAGGFGSHAAAASSASPAPNAPRGLGFGTFKFIGPPDGVDPLSLATSRPECTAELQPIAQKVLAQLGAAAKAYAGGATTLPEVDGVDVTPHGPANGAWYLALGPKIPQKLLDERRQAFQAQGGRRRDAGFGGPGGPGGEGGPPGYKPMVAVGPNESESPRPQMTPSPEMLAALQPFRALASCSYGTVLSPTEAKARGFDIAPPGMRIAAPSPAPSPAPSGAPGGGRGRRAGGFLNYAPSPGIFVVRAPDLGTGGGSLKQ